MSIDCNWFDVSYLLQGKIYTNETESKEMLGLCFVFNKIVCKDDVFLAFKATNCKNICTRVYRMATPNGIDCGNNQTLLIGAATAHFDWM